MSLTLHMHPLSSFCHKVLIALYENDTPFEKNLVDLANESSRAEFLKLWPIGKFPVLRDEAQAKTIPESTVIIEYLAEHYPGKVPLLPTDPALAFEVRFQDRFFDLYLQLPMQKIVLDRMRPEGKNDSHGVELATHQLQTALGLVDQEMSNKTWAAGELFTMADCSAAPALFYADRIRPLGERYPHAAAFLHRLMDRPSFARVLREAEPYFSQFPGTSK